MKKLLILATVLLLCAAGCAKEPSADTKFKSGTYTGEGTGFHGTLKVEVEVSDDEILNVVVTEHEETPGFGTNAVDQLPGIIVEAQSLSVDIVSGATFSSNAILEAVEAALTEAGASEEDLYPAK